MRHLLKLVFTMTWVVAITTLALAVLDDVTKPPIAENKRKALAEALKTVLPPFDNDPANDMKEIAVDKDKKGRDVKVSFYNGKFGGQPNGTAFRVVSPNGYAGNVAVLVGVDSAGVITGIKIVEHHETPGLGDKYTKQSWYDLFKGKSLDNAKLAVKKDGGEIDYTTGATITARAATSAVKRGLEYYKKEAANVPAP